MAQTLLIKAIWKKKGKEKILKKTLDVKSVDANSSFSTRKIDKTGAQQDIRTNLIYFSELDFLSS